MIDPAERRALADALDRFDAAYLDVAQAARRVLLLAEGDEREAFARVAHSMAALPARTAAPAQAPKFSGDACPDCGNFTLVQVGTCKQCRSCYWSGGCG